MSQPLALPCQSLEDEMRSLFGNAPVITPDDMDSLHKAAHRLETDATFQSEFLKGKFVSGIAEAMHNRGMSQSDVAKKWGCSRQYLSKIMNEDRRVNYTFDTAVELAMIVNLKFDFTLVDMDEPICSWRYEKPPERDVTPSRFTDQNDHFTSTKRFALEDHGKRFNFTCQNYGQAGINSSEFNSPPCELPA